MNLDHDFVQVSKSSEDQKKRSSPKMEHFFPEFKWTPSLGCTLESNYWGGAEVDHTQTIGGGYSQSIVGDISSPSPSGFGTPAFNFNSSNQFLVSFDVKSLFTNVPLSQTIDIIANYIFFSDSNDHPPIAKEVFVKLKHHDTECMFLFQDELYKHTNTIPILVWDPHSVAPA